MLLRFTRVYCLYLHLMHLIELLNWRQCAECFFLFAQTCEVLRYRNIFDIFSCWLKKWNRPREREYCTVSMGITRFLYSQQKKTLTTKWRENLIRWMKKTNIHRWISSIFPMNTDGVALFGFNLDRFGCSFFSLHFSELIV